MSNTDIRLSEVIAPHFFSTHKAIKQRDYTEFVLPGGRGSTKSSFVSIEVLLLLKQNPNMHALVCRQVKDTLKDSVYSQLLWAIDILGLNAEFKCIKSPLEIKYIPTGQTIYFRGADDPFKIKSIKPPFGYIGIVWFEELDQFKGQEAVRIIEQSVMRGGEVFYNFKSFNPPITASNWANKYVLEHKPSKLVQHSSYLTVPQKWLGQVFFDEAEHLRETNERSYRHEYLGEPIGSGGNVFENIAVREITDEEIKQFDRIYMGVDWGWYPDPFHWVKCAYLQAQRKLYIYDEYRVWKQTNKQTADYLMESKDITANDELIADSAEHKSIMDYKDYGLVRTRPAEKGPGSVAYSMKWLAGLNEIIIDSKRCPYAAEEFTEYEYERTKDGEIISGYPDVNDHAIDAVRYALNRVWKRRGL